MPKEDLPLLEDMAKFTLDPLGFVQFCFSWGQGELERYDGPDTWQVEVLTEISRQLHMGKVSQADVIRMAIASGNGPGKAQPKNTQIFTPLGYRRFGDLQIGDYVFGKNGRPVRVLGVHDRGTREVFRVSFDDGSSTLTCAEHVWTVRGKSQRRKDRAGGASMEWVNKTTQELASGLRKKNGNGGSYRHWEIPQQGAFQVGHKDVPIQPYLLGLWLGDGCLERITTEDPEIINWCRENYPSIHVSGKQKTGAKTVAFHGIQPRLRSLGLFNKLSYDKFVPEIYKNNSLDVRLGVLQGLIDTDGTVDKNDGRVEFCVTSKQLCDDIVWLVRLLGGKAWICDAVKKTWYYDKDKRRVPCRDAYRVNIRMPNGTPCCRLLKKVNRLKDISQHRYLSRWIDSIEPVGQDDCLCITVDNPDGLYLTNDFIVTHNSCMISWLILWGMATCEDCRGIVTANTENQLRTKTWAELAKWHRLCLVNKWFTHTATAIYSVNPAHEKTWRIDCIPWSENKPEAFAGLHNQGKRVLLFFDEASAIADIIWETAEGALTDENTEIIWCVVGNPTRNSGRFHKCFHGARHRWFNKYIDTRTCKFTNKDQIAKWVADEGEDSDFVRVHVRGVFPKQSSKQFIPNDLVEGARGKHLREEEYNFAPVIIGVDNCWTGEDEGAFVLRQGLMSKVLMTYRKNENDNEVAGYLSKFEDQYRADAVFIDQGWGTGLYSAGKQMGRKWTLVPFGSKSADDGFLNKRAEMWNGLKKWLMEGGSLPNDSVLCDELTGVEYKVGETGQMMGKTYLESKESMRLRGLASPNRGDALALTFAFPVKSKGQKLYLTRYNARKPYDPLSLDITKGDRDYNPLSILSNIN